MLECYVWVWGSITGYIPFILIYEYIILSLDKNEKLTFNNQIFSQNFDENIFILSSRAWVDQQNNKRKLISAICVIEAVGGRGGCSFIALKLIFKKITFKKIEFCLQLQTFCKEMKEAQNGSFYQLIFFDPIRSLS